ncbi:MAG: orotidine-5'-phosphate decarboxylase [Candidatus Aegiribacteria sp.]
METRLYIALTSREMAGRKLILDELAGLPLGIKVGLELFVSQGPALLEEIRKADFPLFLDLKFHDIPFTVEGAVRSACRFEPELLNVHASGGMEMMRAAAEAVEGDTRLLAVTVLTSLSGDDLHRAGFRGSPEELVTGMAMAAREAGIHGVVCSPLEASAVRDAAGPDFLIVTPGVRPAGAGMDDQKRTSTPFEAVKAGATSLVAGRPVTLAKDPRSAAESLLSEINLAFSER